MRFNFKKVASVLASAAMVGSTMGIAAAASYPNAFTGGNGSDVALVVGRSGAQSDFAAATDIGSNLNSIIAAKTVSSGGDVETSGETAALFSGSSKIYLNDSINTNKGTLTKSDLPTVLADGEFNGVEDSKYSQTLVIGSNPRVIYAKQPTSDDDPVTGIKLGSSATTQYLYNATVTFATAMDFTDADSEGETIELFGQEFTVASATSNTDLVLLRSSQTLSLSSDLNPVETVTIDGKTYTIELTAATDTSATLKVTDSNGNSDSKEVNEAQSKKVQGLEVSVNTADESTATNRLTAEVIVGASKVTLVSGEQVKFGSSDTAIEGTNVFLVGGTNATTKLVVQVAAQEDDEDAITPAQSFVDPVFGSFKVDFPGLNIADEDEDNREEILIRNSGSDKMTVLFTNYKGDTPSSSINWVYNKSDSQGGGMKLADSNAEPIRVAEMEAINHSEMVVLGNEDNGGLYEVTTLTNSSSEFKLVLTDVFSGSTAEVTDSTGDGGAVISIEGRQYDVTYNFISTTAQKARTIRLNYPDSSNDMILYPTIETANGANLAFYEPKTVNLGNWDGQGNDLDGDNFRFPDGDGYTDVTIVKTNEGNWTLGGTLTQLNGVLATGASSTTASVGRLTYNLTNTATVNETKIYLQSVGGSNIVRPAIVLFEEQDETNVYEAVIIELDAGYDGDSAGIGVADVERTWGADGANGDSDAWDDVQLESDEDIYKDMDLWGTLITVDKSDSDQSTATISYPDDQVYAQVYISEAAATVSTGDGSGVNVVPMYDDESFGNKNLIVVGGSCINSVAAELLGGALCGPDFTAATGIGAGEYMIETFSRTGGKIATLVAGYNAADTTNGAKSLVNNKPEVDVGDKFKGTTTGLAAV